MGNTYKSPALPKPEKQGLYDPRFEHDACGVGLVAHTKGIKSHDIVTNGLDVLINLGHRGAAGADPETGDGAGILMQLPHDFFVKETINIGIDLPEFSEYGVGVVFLPQDLADRTLCESAIESVVEAEGQTFLGWRDVPVNPENIGSLAARVQPIIRQFFVRRNELPDGYRFNTKLFVI